MLGIDYIEGGWPGANPTDDRFFADPPEFKNAKFTAFGMTRRAGRSAANDPGLAAILQTKARNVCMVGKTWDFHVDVALEVDRDGINVNIVTPGPVETEMLQDVPFEMYAITAHDVAEAVAWLDTVAPAVDLPEIRLNAVVRGPSARPPVVPLEVRRRTGTSSDD